MGANYGEDIHSFFILVKCIHKMILNLSSLQSKAHFTLDLFDKDEYFQFMRLLFKHSEKVTFKGFFMRKPAEGKYNLISQLYLGRKCTFLPRVKIQAFAALAVAKLQAVAK